MILINSYYFVTIKEKRYLDKIFEFIEKECGMINSLKNSFLSQILV